MKCPFRKRTLPGTLNLKPFLTILLAIFFSTACELINPPGEEFDTTVLDGGWFRIESNNPSNDGMTIDVENSTGTVTDPAGSGFANGSVKWSNIVALSETDFEYEELGSDGNYYAATMELLDDTTLNIVVIASGAGNAQTWLKEGSEYDFGDAEPIVLDCNINTPTVLVNGPGEVDYYAECVVDITAELTIEAGVVIAFAENAGFGVYDNGSIKAIGTNDSAVVFQGKQPVAGYWRGIHIETASLNNHLEKVLISDAGSNYVYCCNDAASLFLKGGKMTIKNVEISNGGAFGLKADASAEFFEYSNVQVSGHSDYPVLISSNTVRYMDGTGSDYSGNAMDFVYVMADNLTDNSTWPANNVPYVLEGEVMDITASLTLDAGVEMLVEENGGLGIYDNGTFKTEGTASMPVILRGKEAIAGYWRGIHMETNSINNDLDYLEIHDAGSNYVYCCNVAASLFLKSGRCLLSNVSISNSATYGIATGTNFMFSGFSSVSVSSEDSPLYISAEQANDIESNSDLSGNSSNYIELYNSNISSPVVFTQQQIPYLVGFVIDITDHLVINAGVDMAFTESGGLGVYDAGILSVNGSSGMEVQLRGVENTTGYWRGVYVETNSVNNYLRYTNVHYAGGNYVYCCHDKAAVYVKAGSLEVSDCDISYSGGYGVLVNSGANLTQSGNTYNGNTDDDVFSN